MKLVLQVAHERMEQHDKDFPDPGMIVADTRLVKRGVTKQDVMHILEAVAVTTGMIVIKNRANYEFGITAPVETILEAMTLAAEEEVPAKPKALATKKR